MNKQWLWLCCVLTALILLAGWFLYSMPPSVDAQEGDHKVFLPVIMQGATSTPRPPALYGLYYILESDLPELAALNVKLIAQQTLALPEVALNFLNVAESYDMRVVLRLAGTTDWGWDGRTFDLSLLADFEPVIGGHPALFAVYGLHEPWERFSTEQVQMFYSQWQAVAPSLPVWHDLAYMPPEFTDGMCDFCNVTAYPHVWDQDGNPANEYDYRTWEHIETAQANIRADPDAVLCVAAQAFGYDFTGRPGFRMPTADDMRENASIIFGELQVTCGLWYAYYHRSYDYVLSDPQFGEHRQVVAETYELYFAP